MPADDDEASGPPPDPLDRVWFHPSELGATIAAIGARPGPRSWIVAAVALGVGVLGSFGILWATGQFDDARPASSVAFGQTLQTRADPDPIASVAASAGRSIVSVTVTPPGGEASRVGTGVAVTDGGILTAAHLLGDLPPETTIAVVTVGGRVVEAQFAGTDPDTDLTLLRVASDSVPAARPGSADALRVGQTVVAMAAGPSEQRWVSAGVVSALRKLGVGASGAMQSGLIDSDTRAGQSVAGGALLDANGGLVGILTGSAGYAIPVEVAQDVAAQLATSGHAAHGWLGVAGTDAIDRTGGGVRVRAVADGSPAQAAGVLVGDVITAVADEEVAGLEDLVYAIARRKPSAPVDLVVVRDGHQRRLKASLAPSTGGAPAATLYG
jgi:S1-C subfamily serine protease